MTQTTKVAPRRVNRNFAYDDEAYHEVKRNLKALEKCDLPANEVIAWCSAMLDNDRVGFIPP